MVSSKKKKLQRGQMNKNNCGCVDHDNLNQSSADSPIQRCSLVNRHIHSHVTERLRLHLTMYSAAIINRSCQFSTNDNGRLNIF